MRRTLMRRQGKAERMPRSMPESPKPEPRACRGTPTATAERTASARRRPAATAPARRRIRRASGRASTTVRVRARTTKRKPRRPAALSRAAQERAAKTRAVAATACLFSADRPRNRSAEWAEASATAGSTRARTRARWKARARRTAKLRAGPGAIPPGIELPGRGSSPEISDAEEPDDADDPQAIDRDEKRALRRHPRSGHTAVSPLSSSLGSNRARALHDGEKCPALHRRHRNMKCKDALHDQLRLSIGRRRRAPLLGFSHAIKNPCAEQLGSVRWRHALQMTENRIDSLSCRFAASCRHLKGDFRRVMQPAVLQAHAATSERS
jgi:hypothetical protein